MEVGLNDSHSERMQTFRDMDGSVTGITGATVIRPQEFYVTVDCEYRPNWRMAVCPHWYSRVLYFLFYSTSLQIIAPDKVFFAVKKY